MNNIHFVPECFAETQLFKGLFSELNSVIWNHAQGISNVAKILEKDDNPGYMNIGIIDDDKKNVPSFFDDFMLIESSENFTFKKKPNSNDYIFILNPAIEKFILKQLEYCGLNPSNFSLPDDFKSFKKSLKRTSIVNHKGYEELISSINSNQKAKDIQWIKELVYRRIDIIL